MDNATQAKEKVTVVGMYSGKVGSPKIFTWALSKDEIDREIDGKFPKIYFNGQEVATKYSKNDGGMTMVAQKNGNHILVVIPDYI